MSHDRDIHDKDNAQFKIQNLITINYLKNTRIKVKQNLRTFNFCLVLVSNGFIYKVKFIFIKY